MSVTSSAEANPDKSLCSCELETIGVVERTTQSTKIKPNDLIDTSILAALFFIFVQLGLHRGLDFFVERLVVFQDFFRRIAPLRQLRAFVIQPRTTLLDDLFFQRKIEKRAGQGNAFVVHDVEL